MAAPASDPFGARLCPDHGGRRECRHNKHGDIPCHKQAIRGVDACTTHVGMTIEQARAKGEANIARVRFRDVEPSEYVDPGDVLLWSVTLAHIDLADYRAELREQAEEGRAISETQLDRAQRLQAAAAQTAKMALDAKVDERRVRIAEGIGDRIAQLVRGLLLELGHDPADPEVAAKARKHLELIAGGKAAS